MSGSPGRHAVKPDFGNETRFGLVQVTGFRLYGNWAIPKHRAITRYR
jgi:hypothetical protein